MSCRKWDKEITDEANDNGFEPEIIPDTPGRDIKAELILERDTLTDKRERACIAAANNTFNLSAHALDLLRAQANAMEMYEHILSMRIELLQEEENQ